MSPAVCTRASHEVLKADRATYVSGTTPAGAMHDGLELRNCKLCNSSLADGTMLDPVNAAFNSWVAVQR